MTAPARESSDDDIAAILCAAIDDDEWRLTKDIAAHVEKCLGRFVSRVAALKALGELEEDGLVERVTDWRAVLPRTEKLSGDHSYKVKFPGRQVAESRWRWAPEPTGQEGGAA